MCLPCVYNVHIILLVYMYISVFVYMGELPNARRPYRCLPSATATTTNNNDYVYY